MFQCGAGEEKEWEEKEWEEVIEFPFAHPDHQLLCIALVLAKFLMWSGEIVVPAVTFLFSYPSVACTQKVGAAGEGIALPLGGGIWPQVKGVFLSV